MKVEDVKDTLDEYDLSIDEFMEWINGQTVGMNEDGSVDYYEVDVAKFINWKVYGKPYSWD